MATIDELRAALSEATQARRQLELARSNDRHERIQAVEREIIDKYSADLVALIKSQSEAQRALDAAEAEAGRDKLKDYPAGIVAEWKVPYERWSREVRPAKPTGRRAIYELRTLDTQFAANVGRYRQPKMGEVFLRILKKDGTPGTKFETLNGLRADDWRPETAASETAT